MEINAAYYKYRKFDNHTFEIIKESSLFYSPPKYFNDPFDCNINYKITYTKEERIQSFNEIMKRNPNHTKTNIPYLYKCYSDNKHFTKLHKGVTERLLSQIGVLALSSDCTNILMWSHYANNHKGLVFEFKPTFLQGDSSECFPTYPTSVLYEEDYQLASYADDEMMKILMTKYIDWQYEKEYRYIDLYNQRTKKFYKHELTTIIFGAKAEENDIRDFIALCKNHGFEHIKFKKAEMAFSSFSLTFNDLNFD